MAKKLMRSVSAIIAVVLMMTCFATTAFAANTDPYGWYWTSSRVDKNTLEMTESSFKKTDFYLDNKDAYTDPDIRQVGSEVLSYYAVNNSGRMQQKTWVFYKGANVYNMSGKRIASDLRGESDAYIGYDVYGTLYRVTSAGKLLYTKDNGSKWTTVLSSGVSRLYINDDSLVYSVGTSAGTKTIESLVGNPSGTNPPSSDIRNGVEVYMVETGDVIFDAYKNGSVHVTVTCDNSYVYCAGYTLSANVRGAKFVGIDSSYNVYLQNTDGVIYKIAYGKWTTYTSVKPAYNVTSFSYDEDGFFTGIRTSGGNYALSELKFK